MKKKATTNAMGLQLESRASYIKRSLLRDWQLYTLLIPALVAVILFHYVPMYGVQIAFKNFKISKGIWGSAWVGLKYFDKFVHLYNFKNIIFNTLSISVYSLVVGFPIPIFLALVLNECRNLRFKKIVQTVSYAPHFISTVVMCGMLILFMNKNNGLLNNIGAFMGLPRVDMWNDPKLFSTIYVLSDVWQHAGWSSILYISALSSVSPEIVEAAYIDGASRFRKVISIDIPSILPTVIIMLIMRCGQLMSVGHEKVLLLQTDLNIDASEIISTFTYRIGLVDAQYSYSTAIGLFNSVINFILLMTVNWISGKVSETSLW